MQNKEQMDFNTLLENILITAGIFIVATVLAIAFFHYSLNSTSVAIIYVLAVMLVARYTTGYVPGIVATFFGVICVNYVFTYPFMTLNFSIDGYPVTFVVMAVISGLTSALTSQFKKQNEILNEREKLLMDVWGFDFYGDDRTVDTHIKMLRSNLKQYRKFIVTLRGLGYKFEV